MIFLTVSKSLVRYTAAKKDSKVSATIDGLSLPPVNSSPLPNLKYSGNPNFFAYVYQAFSHT